MHFLELTNYQDATVPVPVFCCFSFSEKLLRKYPRNWTKINGHQYFTETSTEPEGEPEKRQGAPSPWLGAAQPHATPRGGVGPSGALRRRPFSYIILLTRKPEVPALFSMKSSRAAAVVKPYSGGFLKLFPASCRRGDGDHHRRALHHHAGLWSDA